MKIGAVACLGLAFVLQAQSPAPRAARSVHLRYSAPQGTVFYNEVTVSESVPATYFATCGFDNGYFGIQELLPGKGRVVIFSVWDPGNQDDPGSVTRDRRVEVLFHAPDVEIHRFGGEGTGGQSLFHYDWRNGETYRFMVEAKAEKNKTTFAAYFFMNETKSWKHLATFRTITGGTPLDGYYSFVEDFRRDGKSLHERRRARYANGWVKTLDGKWVQLTSATFTGDDNPSTNVDARVEGHGFELATGGDTRNHTPLNTVLKRQVSQSE